MDGDAEFVAVLGEAPRHVDAHALPDVVQDLLIAAFIADQQQPQAVVAHCPQRVARDIGFGVARPGDAELAELACDRLRARQIVGEGVIVEEELLHLRERISRPADFVDDIADAAGAIAVAADGLRPEAEGAARFAAAPGVKREIRMLEIADEIILDLQVAFVHRRDERQFVHVLQDRARRVVPDCAGGIAIGEAGDCVPAAPFGDFLDGEVELVAGDKIDRRRALEARLRLDRDLGADEAGFEARIGRLERFDDPHVRAERGRRGMQHREIEVGRLAHDVG